VRAAVFIQLVIQGTFMEEVEVVQAKSRLSALLDRVEPIADMPPHPAPVMLD
jgi:hypothetical protein